MFFLLQCEIICYFTKFNNFSKDLRTFKEIHNKLVLSFTRILHTVLADNNNNTSCEIFVIFVNNKNPNDPIKFG